MPLLSLKNILSKPLDKAGKRRKYLLWAGVSLLFLLITAVHMGSTFTNPTTQVMNNPGDHTAGIMYTSWVNPDFPIPGVTSLTNYPFGENLRQPLAVTTIVPQALHLIFSKVSTIAFGWNMLVLLGYMSNALVMFGFMYWLTKNGWASLFAAYAVTYTPYHAFASMGQIAGLLSAIFIAAFWQFMAMWRKPSWIKGAILGAIFGVGFYTDGYFILIGLVLLMSLWVASVGYGLLIGRLGGLVRILPQLRALALASVVAAAMLLPLAWINFRYSAQIESIFGTARGDIVGNAQTYSAQLAMYVNTKSLIFLGFSVLALAVVGLVLLWRDYRKSDKQQLLKPDSTVFAGWAAAITALLATWISLRPKGQLLGLTIYNPSAVIITFTSAWRVFGRLYVLVAVGCAVLAGLGLAWLMRRFSNYKYWIVAASFLLVAVELWTFSPPAPAANFDYQKAPPVYSWLKDNPKVRAVAEYPLDNPPYGEYLSDYYTFQEISSKPLLNTLLTNSTNSALRQSLAGINDPQTLPVLRALGIDMVNIRPANVDGQSFDLRPVAAGNAELEKTFSHDGRWHIDSFLIKPGKAAAYALVMPGLEHTRIVLTADGRAVYKVGDDSSLSLFRLPNAPAASSVEASFVIAADSERQATIVQNGTVLWSGTLTPVGQSVSLKASPDYPITVHNQITTQPTQISISKLQAL